MSTLAFLLWCIAAQSPESVETRVAPKQACIVLDPFGVFVVSDAPFRVVPANAGWLCVESPEFGFVRACDVMPVEEAESYYTALIKSEDRALWHERRGACRRHHGERDRALADWRAALKLGGDVVRNNVRIMRDAFELGRVADALAALDIVIEREPRPELFQGRAMLRMLSGDERGIDDLLEYGRTQPDTAADRLSGFAIIFLGTNQLALAEKAADGAITLVPTLAMAYAHRAEIRKHRKNFTGAMYDAEEAVRLSPNDATVLAMRASILFARGDAQGALDQLASALALTPDSSDILRLRTGVYEYLGEHGKCIDDVEHLDRTMAADDLDRIEVHARLAWVLATSPDDSLRNGAEALRQAAAGEQMLNKFPPQLSRPANYEAIVLLALAAGHAETGNFDEAIRCQKEALKKARQPEMRRNFSALLKLYQQGRPYRSAPGSLTIPVA